MIHNTAPGNMILHDDNFAFLLNTVLPFSARAGGPENIERPFENRNVAFYSILFYCFVSHHIAFARTGRCRRASCLSRPRLYIIIKYYKI